MFLTWRVQTSSQLPLDPPSQGTLTKGYKQALTIIKVLKYQVLQILLTWLLCPVNLEQLVEHLATNP
jgi:hypothetical protein